MTAPISSARVSGLASLADLRGDDAAWDAFVAESAAPSHMQRTAWARAKAANGWRPLRVVADGGSGPIGAQVLLRRLGPGPFSLGYAPRGPIATTFDGASIAALTGALRRAAKHHRLTHVTVDPGLEGEGPGEILRAAGWQPAEKVQQHTTRLIDLARPEAELWSGLRSKWRQYVQKARRGGYATEDVGEAGLDAFFAIMVDTARRRGYIHRSADAYRQTYRAFADSGSARLLLARAPGGDAVATLMLIGCGQRMTEVYGGSTQEGAEGRTNYLLKWESIRSSQERGFTSYDVSGTDLPGLAAFKAGFGGREVTYCGTWDLVTLPLLRDGLVRARQGYVRLARRRHGSVAAAIPGGPASPDG